jgi:hypothetical protein
VFNALPIAIVLVVDGLAGFSLIDLVVVLGVAVVLPLAMGGRWWRWGVAGVAVGIALMQDRGVVAAALVLPWVGVVAAAVLQVVRRAGPLMFWTRADVVRTVARIYVLVAAGALVQSRLGVRLFGIREPILQLAAVHYLYAGGAALVLAGAVSGGRSADAAVLCTALAPPIVAFGFVTRAAIPQVGGAVLLTVGVWMTAGLELREVGTAAAPVVARVLLGISGLAIWVPMVLAVAWAAGQHWDVPYLSISDMARLHGLPNALAFTVAGLSARRLQGEVLT